MATAGARANPHKMPQPQWIYALFALIGGFFSFVVFWLAVPEVARLWALGGLPRYAGVPIAGGAIYRGVLDGPVDTTALGRPAVAWIGVVTQTTRHGKGTYTAETCRIGRVSELRLAGDGRALGDRAARSARRRPQARVQRRARLARRATGSVRTETVSPLPDDVVARCHIDRERARARRLEVREQAASPGSCAEFAGCASGDVLGRCGGAGGIAAGHLSTAGMRAMVRRMADGADEMMAVFILLTMFFAAFGAIDAVLALRAAAPLEVAAPQGMDMKATAADFIHAIAYLLPGLILWTLVALLRRCGHRVAAYEERAALGAALLPILDGAALPGRRRRCWRSVSGSRSPCCAERGR